MAKAPCPSCGDPVTGHVNRKYCKTCRPLPSNKKTIECAGCGAPMWAGKGSLPEGQATCRPCRSKTPAAPYQKKSWVVPCACLECLTPIAQTDGSPKLYCSKPCRDRSRGRRREPSNWTRPCRTCGESFTAQRKSPNCDACMAAATDAAGSRYPKPAGPEEPKTCQACDSPFPGTSSRRVYCSEDCATAEFVPRIMALYRLAMRELDIPKASMWRHRLCTYLAERDGGRCHICDKRVDLTLPSGPRGDDMGPSIDHLVPRSLGGGDGLENLALTHWACNRSKRVTATGEQLRLVG